MICLKTEHVRIYMGRAKSKPVANPTSAFLIGTCSPIIFAFLSTTPTISTLENGRFAIFTVSLELTHYHMQLNNCTKPLVNQHLWWVHFRETPRPPFTLSSMWRSFSLSEWPCLEGTVIQVKDETSAREKRKGHFPPLKAPHRAVQDTSYCIFLILSQLFETNTSAMERFRVLKSWSQVTKTLLSLIVSFWFSPAPFWVWFWNLSGAGQSHQLWWYLKPGRCISVVQPSLSCLHTDLSSSLTSLK